MLTPEGKLKILDFGIARTEGAQDGEHRGAGPREGGDERDDRETLLPTQVAVFPGAAGTPATVAGSIVAPPAIAPRAAPRFAPLLLLSLTIAPNRAPPAPPATALPSAPEESRAARSARAAQSAADWAWAGTPSTEATPSTVTTSRF